MTNIKRIFLWKMSEEEEEEEEMEEEEEEDPIKKETALLARIKANDPGLKEIRIVDTPETDDFLGKILEVFRENTHVESLVLHYMVLMDAFWHVGDLICLQNSPIRHLDIANSNLDENSMQFLAASIGPCPFLQTLDISDNELGVEGAKHMASALRENKYLQELNMSRTFIGNAGFEEIVASLLPGVGKNSTLRKLRVADNEIDENSAGLLRTLIGDARSSLRVLELSRNPIGDAGILACSDALRDNPALCDLALCRVGLTTIGLNSLIAGLETNTFLRYLDISDNLLERQGIKAVAGLIETNRTLWSLSFGTDANLTRETCVMIYDALMVNGIILKVSCGNNARYAKWVPLLQRNIKAYERWLHAWTRSGKVVFEATGRIGRDPVIHKTRGQTRWWTDRQREDLETFKRQKAEEAALAAAPREPEQQRRRLEMCIQCGINGPKMFHELGNKARIFCGRKCQVMNYNEMK